MDTVTDLKTRFAQMSSDPDFISLNYQDQFNVRASVAANILPRDPDFATLADADKLSVLEDISRQTPALQDKKLESYVTTAVSAAKKGDSQAAQMVSGLANANAMGRASVFGSLVGKFYGAMNMPGQPSSAISPLGTLAGSQQKSLMDGSDAAKLSAYFGELGARDPQFSKDANYKLHTGESRLVGQFVDSVPFMLVPGGALEGLGVKGAAAIATSSRIVANASKLIIPAAGFALGGSIGNVARQNALAAIQANPDMYTDTAKKLASSAGEGAAMNFLFSLGIRGAAEFAIPAIKALIRGPIRNADLASTGILWWKKAANPAAIDRAIKAAGGTSAIPAENILSLHPYVRDSAWIRNYTAEALSRDASTADLRPLDQLAIASNDAPDIIFAPKDWSKPMDSGFNIWEMKAEKTNKNLTYLMTGDASSLGDLRSKLSDAFSARFDGINDLAKPQSMQASQAFIAQGKLQALNAKAYDPFPETVAKGFTRPSLRGYLSPTEAQDAAYASIANGGQAYHVKIDATPEMMKRIESNKAFLSDGAPLTATPVTPEQANALAIIAKPTTQDAIASANVFAARAVKEGAGWTEAEARKHFLVQQGFDGIVDTNAGTVEAFFPSRMKWITDQFDPATGKLLPRGAARIAESGPLGSKIALSAKIESSIGKEALGSNPQTLANVAMAKFKGSLQSTDVQNFVSQLTDAKGIPKTAINVRKISGAIDSLGNANAAEVLRQPDGSILVNVPEKITGFGPQKAFVNDLVSGLDKLGAEAAPGTKFSALGNARFTKAVNVTPSRFSLPFDTEAANRTWLNSVAQSEFSGSSLTKLRDGSYALQDASGKVQGNYASLGDARDSMMLASLDERFIRGDLYRQGYKLTGQKGSAYTLGGPSLAKPITGNNLQDLLKQIDYKPSRISNRLAPADVQITPDKTMTTFDGKTMLASKNDVAKALAKFENPDELASMVNIKHTESGDAFKLVDGSVRVDVPSLAATRYFTSVDDAKAFLDSDLKSMKSLKDAAGRKGLSLYDDHDTGGYLIGDGEKVLQVKSADEASKVLQSYPDSPGAREILSALDPQADDAVKAVIAKLDPELTKAWKATNFDRSTIRWDGGAVEEMPLATSRGAARPGIKASIRNWSSSYDRYTEATVNRELGLKDLADMRNTLGRSAKALRTQIDSDQSLHAAIFTDEHGRPMKIERKEAIAAYKEAQGLPESLPAVKEKYGDLSSHEQDVLGKVSTLTDQYAKRFGVDPSTYVKGYMSHVRKYVLSHWDAASGIVSADDLLEQAYHGLDNVPKGLKAFFHNERAESLLNASMESDPEKILNRYVEAGNKEMLLKQPMQDMLDYLKTNGKNLPGDVVSHTLYDMKTLGGHHEIIGMAQAEDTLEAIHNAFSKVPGLGKLVKPLVPGTGAKMFQNFMSLTYLGNVGFRPWLAVRNMLQPYNMLAPRIGLQPVLDAQKQVLGADGKAIMLRLRSEGTLMNSTPVAANIGVGKLARLTQKSMSMIYTADDVTRATAAVAAENMLDEGIRNWSKGVFKNDIQKFKNFTELRAIQAGNPQLSDQIAQLALSGDPLKVKQAKVLFGQKLAFETQPDYARYAQPHVFTNTLPGYVFGRFGTYSTAYRENIYRGWQAAQGFGNKALFASRFIGIGLGIAGGLSAMGIEGKDFTPGYGGLFGGGPQFTEALALAQSPGANSSGEAARRAVEKAFLPATLSEKTGAVAANYPAVLPGSLQLKYLKEFSDAASQGDYWKAFLAATTTPMLK
jgi:hypothetical protein